MKKIPKLTVVGAGPGDPDLITIKGVNALASADAILYDALVNPELLKYARAGIPKIYVGKRSGQHSFTQPQINALIARYAFACGHVVRLKGGDPFVFGRGFEEIQSAARLNITTEYIPGISSSIGVPGLQGIPVTSRGVSESFWVITGTTASGQLSEDIITAAKTKATVVILMGLSKLQEIVDAFQLHQKQDTAIAIIQNGSLPDEKIALGTLETIVRIANEKAIGAPAVIIIGEVVKLHSSYISKYASNISRGL